jgi:hypothetical protein
MAKTPSGGGPNIGFRGGSGANVPGGFSGGSTPQENAKFLQKVQEALAKQTAEEAKNAAVNQQAAEVQQEAAESIQESAETQQEAADKISEAAETIKTSSQNQFNASKIFLDISTSLKGAFNSFTASVKNFAEAVRPGAATPDETPTNTRASILGKIDSIEEKLSSILQVNQDLLNAADSQGEVFYKILEAVMNLDRGGGGGRGRGGGGGSAPPGGGRGGRGNPPPQRPIGVAGGVVAGAGVGAGSILGGAGSLLGGAGGLLGGLGAALAGGGLGALLFSAADAKSIKDNVETLLSIGEGYEDRTDFLKAGGALTLALAGIGAGLAVFGVGQAAVGLAQFISDDKWTETLKKNVVSLLSLSDELGGNWEMLKEGGAFGLAMTGIGIGLGAFGAGQAAVGLAQFISSDNWAEKVLNNVKTLLSISQLDGVGWDTVKFIGVMGGLALGLATFAIGQGTAIAADALDKTYQMFTGEGNFADRILLNVQKLLSITSLPGVGVDTAGFVAVMGGIAAGLVAFAFGKGANVAVDELDAAFAHFTGNEPFADRIYNQVAKLLSITQIQTGDGKSFVATMTDIVAGLTVFTAGNFVDTLLSVGTKLLSFLSGKESPIDRVLQLADNAENLTKGADALQKIASALTAFSNIKTGNLGDIDFEGLAKNLGKAIPTLQALSKGGKIGGGIFGFGEVDFGKGILDPELRLDEMAAAIAKINYVLGRTTSLEVPVTPGAPAVGNQSSFNAASSSFSTMAAAGPPPVIVNNNTVNNTGGGNQAQASKIGGAISTQPSQSHIDRALYGWNDMNTGYV